MEDDPILKLIGLPRSETLDPKFQMEYDQVNQNFRMLADIRFKLLALVPPLGGVAIFALAKMAGPEEVGRGQSALVLLVASLGFLATLGITFYDQRNSELYNALNGRANYLEYRARLTRNPVLGPPKSSFSGQFLERPGPGRRLFGIPFLLMKHDRGLALIYGPVLGAWFFPITYAAVGLFKFSAHPLRWAISLTSIMIVAFIFELIRLDGAFSNNDWGECMSNFHFPQAPKIKLEYIIRGDKRTLIGEPAKKCKVEMHDGSTGKLEGLVITRGARLRVYYYEKSHYYLIGQRFISKFRHPSKKTQSTKEKTIFKIKLFDEFKRKDVSCGDS